MASGIKREALHIEGPTIGYAAMSELAKKVGVVTPFVVWPIALVMAFVLHQFWPDNMWVLAFIATMAVAFAWLGWYLTHDRKGLASEHMVLTILAYGALFSLVDAMGWTRFTVFLMIFGVFAICCSWSMRNVVRHHDESQGANINKLFESAGVEGAKMHVKPLPGETRKRMTLPFSRGSKPAETKQVEVITDAPKVGKQRSTPIGVSREAKIILKPGQTVDDLLKKVDSIESAGETPPGTFSVTPNEDNARIADVVLSDPRAIKNPSPWPGPSWIGGSIADTISVGMYQDGTEIEFDILGLQIQIMGMIGSAKSLGAGWNALAEIVTRHDAIVWGVDITKGDQTLGPLRPALHRLATTPDEAMRLLQDANDLIKPRTDYLAKKGMPKWQKGCGLKYLVVWLEEVPDIMEALENHERGELSGVDIWLKSVKAARSAGITFVWSLQRADFTQVPTLARGQAAKWCFGVADSHEASFGLSKLQDDAGCEPERWGNRSPGKCFLDAPSIPIKKVPMPGRTWYWGPDSKLIHAHALKYPASEREEDEVMKAVLGRVQVAEPPVSTPTRKSPDTSLYLGNNESERMEDTEDITDAELDQELADLTTDMELTTGKVEPLPPEAARAVLRDWLEARPGETVRNRDLLDVRLRTGRTREWSYPVMREFERSGLVRRIDSDDGIAWEISEHPQSSRDA